MVRIDVVPQSLCSFVVPFQVPDIISMTGIIGQPVLTINYVGDEEATGMMDQEPKLKVTDKIQPAGRVRQHEVQAAVTDGLEGVRSAVAALQGVDFNILLTTADGERYLCYALPNTAQITLQEQMSATADLTVKAVVQSMSGPIRLSAS